MASPISEVVSHSVTLEHSRAVITIELIGHKSTDSYATNLNLTGCTNWFGSSNLCTLMAADAKELFGVADSSDRTTMKKCSLLELGSGLGRAGIMAARIMQSEGNGGSCVLTDGEEEIVDLLKKNCDHNGVFERSRRPRAEDLVEDSLLVDVGCVCQPLWWGDRASLDTLLTTYPGGFDIIIGADLIYGPLAGKHLAALMCTVDSLLARHSSYCNSPETNLAQPVFYLAFTRRGPITIEELCESAMKYNLTHTIMDDYTFDLFGNNVETDSMFWGDTIIAFRRGGTPPS